MDKSLILVLIAGVAIGLLLALVTPGSPLRVTTSPIVVEDSDGIILVGQLNASATVTQSLLSRPSILVQDAVGAYAKGLQQPRIPVGSARHEPQMVMIQDGKAIHSHTLSEYPGLDKTSTNTRPTVVVEHGVGALGIRLEATDDLPSMQVASSGITIEYFAGTTEAALSGSRVLTSQTWSITPSVTIEHTRSILDGSLTAPIWMRMQAENQSKSIADVAN